MSIELQIIKYSIFGKIIAHASLELFLMVAISHSLFKNYPTKCLLTYSLQIAFDFNYRTLCGSLYIWNIEVFCGSIKKFKLWKFLIFIIMKLRQLKFFPQHTKKINSLWKFFIEILQIKIIKKKLWNFCPL